MQQCFIMMRPDWQELPNGDIHPAAAGISVSINPKGQIAMSRVTHQMLDEPPAFVIYFDKVNSRIGLKPATLATKNAYRACKYTGRSGAKVIHANRLIREHRIDLPQTVRFDDADINEDGILVLDLRTAQVSKRVTNHHRNRKKKVSGEAI